jgi:hypothetical protein
LKAPLSVNYSELPGGIADFAVIQKEMNDKK